MKLVALTLAFIGCAQSLLIIEPLPWEDTWKELVIKALDEVNHKELIDSICGLFPCKQHEYFQDIAHFKYITELFKDGREHLVKYTQARKKKQISS